MKKLNFLTLIFTGLLLTVSFSAAKAQEEQLPDDAPQSNFNQPRRPNLLAELDLSTAQIQQIRRINRSQKLLKSEAQQRFLAASRSLDQAIYADNLNDNEIQARLKEVQLARAELFKIKAMNEYAVRKILTPEQLVKFREVRQRFMERLENLPKTQKDRPFNAPNRRLLNRQRRMRPND